MNLVYAKKTEERIYEISIIGAIGDVVNGDYIATDIAFINKNKLADRINLRINTEGGNVINGLKIIGSIMNSTIPVHTYNDGVAYSMGFELWISARLENRHAAFFASWMAHAARFIDEDGQIVEPDNEDDKSFLSTINNAMNEVTLNSLGKTKEEVLKIMSKDTFFNPSEMVSYGFINAENVIKYNSMPQFKAEHTIQDKIKTIAAFYNAQDNNSNNNNKMVELQALATKMNLTPDAAIGSYVAKYEEVVGEKDEALKEVKSLQDEQNKNITAIKDLEKNNKTLESKIVDFEEKEKVLKAEASKTKVDEAIKAGKFKEENREELTAIAIETPEVFDKMVSMAQVTNNVKAPDVTALLKSDNISEIAAKVSLEAKDMDYDNLWKNNPNKLDEIKAIAPKLHDAMQSKWMNDNDKK